MMGTGSAVMKIARVRNAVVSNAQAEILWLENAVMKIAMVGNRRQALLWWALLREDNTVMGESCGVVESVMENAWNAVVL
jgi:hypothetical protein